MADERPPRRHGGGDSGPSVREGTGIRRRPIPSPAKSSFILAEAILLDIIRNDLKPGDALPPERVMIDHYQMGRGTVREALRLLEYQGAVQIRTGPNGGPVVSNPNSNHFASTIAFLMQLQRTPFQAIVEVRVAIEPMICRLAAERISDASLNELKSTIADMRRIVGEPAALNEFHRLNTRFHNVTAWASGNPLFSYLADSLLDIMDGAVVGINYPEDSQRGVIAAHEAIVAALTERNPDGASKAMERHLNEWQAYAKTHFPTALEEMVVWTGSFQRGASR